MREIEFRGRMKNGHWVHGYLSGCHTIVVDIDEYERVGFQVDSFTIGQYTGLKDKNGQKIYEGDVVEVTSCMEEVYIAEVVFDHVEWELCDDSNGDPVSFYNQAWHCEKTLEVIGNIRDNPKLLEG